MSNIITDIKSLQDETLLNLQHSKAINTVRAYKSDFNDFGLFCVKNGFKQLPSDPKIVSLYLTYLSTKNVKMSTIKRRLVSIGVIHKLKGHYLDTKHPSIIENMMGIKRRKGSFQRGKKPLLINNLKQVKKYIFLKISFCLLKTLLPFQWLNLPEHNKQNLFLIVLLFQLLHLVFFV